MKTMKTSFGETNRKGTENSTVQSSKNDEMNQLQAEVNDKIKRQRCNWVSGVMNFEKKRKGGMGWLRE